MLGRFGILRGASVGANLRPVGRWCRVEGLGLRVSGLVRAWGLGFGVQGLGLRGVGFRVWGFVFGDLMFRKGFGFRRWGVEFRVSGLSTWGLGDFSL